MNPPSDWIFSKEATIPKGAAEVRRIRVFTDTYFGSSYVCGIRFFNGWAGVVLSAGLISKDFQEVSLEVSERLIGIRSTLYSNDSRNGTIHCNMKLVIGRIE